MSLLFLYAPGVTPVMLLNTLQKLFASAKPACIATDSTDKLVSLRRLQETLAGTVRYRPHDKPIYDSKTSKLSKIPDEWKDGGNN